MSEKKMRALRSDKGGSHNWTAPHGSRLGHTFSDETRQKMSDAKKGVRYYNDGKKTIRLKKIQPVPEGFVRGRLMSEAHKEKLREFLKCKKPAKKKITDTQTSNSQD